MKKTLFGVILLSCLTLLSCKKDKDKVADLTDLALNCEELVMAVGDKYQLVTTLTPADAAIELTWESSKESVVSVANGEIKALKAGKAKVTVSYGTLSAKCVIEVCDKPKVGDYLYANGTWGKDVKDNVVAVIFTLEDATKDDPILKKEHPFCTHGVAASVKLTTIDYWQEKNGNYYNSLSTEDKELAFLNAWAGKHGFVDGRLLFNNTTKEHGNVLLLGYNNTAAIRKFNSLAENSEWPINCVDSLDSFARRIKVAESTSGWFIPSYGDYIFFLGGSRDAKDGANANVEAMNTALQAVTGAFDLAPHMDDIAVNGIEIGSNYIVTSTDIFVKDNNIQNWYETIVYTCEQKVDWSYDDSFYKDDDYDAPLRPFVAF